MLHHQFSILHTLSAKLILQGSQYLCVSVHEYIKTCVTQPSLDHCVEEEDMFVLYDNTSGYSLFEGE